MNKILRILFFAFILILFVQNASAIGITPGRNSIDYSSGEKDYSFSILNTENKAMRVAFSVGGELSRYIKITNEIQEFKPDESSKTFRYVIGDMIGLSPGLHKANIIALELPDGNNEDGTVIKTSISVVHQVYVFVPYPGKYVDVGLDIVNKEEQNLVLFYIPLISRGEERVEKVSAVINIYKNYEKITSFETTSTSLNPSQKGELSASWSPEVVSGEYIAVTEVNYDGEIVKIEKKFNVGNESLGILSIGTNDFHLGDIARIRILVQNKMNDDVAELKSNMKIYDSGLSKIADFNSESYEIPALSNKEVLLYWDTGGLEKGDYSSELKLNYNDKFLNKNFKIRVNDNSMTFTGVGFVIKSGGSRISITTFLFAVVGILVLFNIAWFILWMKKKSLKKIKKTKVKAKISSGRAGVIVYNKKSKQ